MKFVQWEEKARQGYLDGYRNGHCDRRLGNDPLAAAMHSTYPGYAMGYRDGYNGRPNQAGEDE